jgi:enoyl-CoA hydratase/carnithine racemase
MIDVRREGGVVVLTMNAGQNRFNQPFLEALNAALDQVESSADAHALVTTGGEEKFYSNGLDLDWLMGAGQEKGEAFLRQVFGLLARVLAFPVPTVAALNGHAFAGGAMLALAHDCRVMRADRGFFCLPEVDINLPLAPGMLALIQSKLGILTCRELILSGRRVGGPEAVGLQVVDEAVPAGEVVSRAVARAAAAGPKGRATYGALKRGMYAGAIRVLHEGRITVD